MKREFKRTARVIVILLAGQGISAVAGQHSHPAMPPTTMPMSHDRPAATDSPQSQPYQHGLSIPVTTANATGVINAVMVDSRQVTIHHGPIEAWNMNAMQMKFRLAPHIDIDGLQAGQSIRFQVRREGIGQYVIIELQPVAAGNP